MEKINVKKSINTILISLRDKEREILANRFGLNGEKPKTLAGIGEKFNLTRERIRQIQNHALNKIKNTDISKAKIFAFVQRLTQKQGGLITVNDVAEKLATDVNRAYFILEASKNLKRIKGYKNLSNAFINQEYNQADIIAAEKTIIGLLKKTKKALELPKLINKYLNYAKNKFETKTIESLINASKSYAFDWKKRIGLATWREINPKSARDKAYFVLKKEERPLHFTHIAELITNQSFCGKNPKATTVHNELILDDRFVLVGRGIYALSEWGFRGGTVEDIIYEILRSNPKGMQRDDIIEEVLKTKLVARNTIMMNLLVKKQFLRDKKGLYHLAK